MQGLVLGLGLVLIVHSPIAQRIERLPSKQGVEGSSPSGATIWKEYIVTGYAHGCTNPKDMFGKPMPERKPQRGANGKWPIPNITVAADKSIPFGTKIHISHNGKIFKMEVGDRGRDIVGNRLDIFFPSCSHAKRWGKRKVHVKIIHDRRRIKKSR